MAAEPLMMEGTRRRRVGGDGVEIELGDLSGEPLAPTEGPEDEGEEQGWWGDDESPPAWAKSWWARKLGTTAQVWEAWVMIQATLGFVGSVLLWCGHWNLFTAGKLNHKNMAKCLRHFANATAAAAAHASHATHDPHDPHGNPHDHPHDPHANGADTHAHEEWFRHHCRDPDLVGTQNQRTVAYLVIGFVLSLWADNLTSQAGLPGLLFNPCVWGYSNPRPGGWRWLFVIRWYIGMVGMVAFWTGLNDAFDYNVGYALPGDSREWIYMGVGLVGVLVLHGNIDGISYCYTERTLEEEGVSWRDPLWRRLAELLRATLSIVAQSLMWLGAWNAAGLNSSDVVDAPGYYPAGLTLYGVAAMLMCKSYVSTSWIEAPDPTGMPATSFNAMHFLRSFIALTGYYNAFNGLWAIFDVQIIMNDSLSKSNAYRNVGAVLVGAFLTLVAGSWVSNALAEYPEDEEDGNDEGVEADGWADRGRGGSGGGVAAESDGDRLIAYAQASEYE